MASVKDVEQPAAVDQVNPADLAGRMEVLLTRIEGVEHLFERLNDTRDRMAAIEALLKDLQSNMSELKQAQAAQQTQAQGKTS